MNLFTLYLFSADSFFVVAIGYRYIYLGIFINLYFALVPFGGRAILFVGVAPVGAGFANEPIGIQRARLALINWYQRPRERSIRELLLLKTDCG